MDFFCTTFYFIALKNPYLIFGEDFGSGEFVDHHASS